MSQNIAQDQDQERMSIDLKEFPVSLLIGPKKQCIYVHDAVLSASSEFFKAALKTEWSDGPTRTIKLPHDKYDTVEGYLQFLYSNSVTMKETTLGSRAVPDYYHLDELYVFGEKILDVSFQNKVMDAILALQWPKGLWVPDSLMIDLVYEGTPPESPLRRLMVHSWHDIATSSWVDSKSPDGTKWPYDFLVDVTAVLLDARNGSNASLSRKLVEAANEYHKPIGET